MRKTRILFALCVITLVCAALAAPAMAADPVFLPNSGHKLMIDGEPCDYTLPVASYNGSTMLPLRLLVTDLGIPNDDEHIQYVAATREITLVSADGATVVWLQQGNDKAWVEKDGERTDFTLVCPVQQYQGNTYVPVRFVAQSLGMTVGYDAGTRTVLIRTPESLAAADAYLAMDADDKAVKMTVALTADAVIVAQGQELPLEMTGEYQIDMTDLEQLKMAVTMTVDMLGQTQDMEMYLDDGTLYVSADGEVVKMPLAAAGASLDDIMSMADTLDIMSLAEGLEEELRLRTFVTDGPEEGQLAIATDAAFVFDENSPIMGLMAGVLPAEVSFTVEKYAIDIIADAETGLPLAMVIDVTMSMGGDMPMTMDIFVEMAIDYSDFTVTVPQEIIDAAVDVTALP